MISSNKNIFAILLIASTTYQLHSQFQSIVKNKKYKTISRSQVYHTHKIITQLEKIDYFPLNLLHFCLINLLSSSYFRVNVKNKNTHLLHNQNIQNNKMHAMHFYCLNVTFHFQEKNQLSFVFPQLQQKCDAKPNSHFHIEYVFEKFHVISSHLHHFWPYEMCFIPNYSIHNSKFLSTLISFVKKMKTLSSFPKFPTCMASIHVKCLLFK